MASAVTVMCADRGDSTDLPWWCRLMLVSEWPLMTFCGHVCCFFTDQVGKEPGNLGQAGFQRHEGQ